MKDLARTANPSPLLRALSWNLFHGRDHPPDPRLLTTRSRLLRVTERNETQAQVNRSLFEEFAGLLGGWEWQVALLQEAPPRWLSALGERCGAHGALALTSRNSLPALRACAAERNPDLIASNEGGSNQVLVRPPWRVAEVAREVVVRRPERRVLLLTRLAGPGDATLCVGCLHASRGPHAAARDVARAADLAAVWGKGEPLLFGGDLNVRPHEAPGLYDRLAERHGFTAPLDGSIDQLLARDLEPGQRPRALEPSARELACADGRRLRLSDHDVVVASFRMR